MPPFDILLRLHRYKEDSAKQSKAEAEKLATECIKLGSENMRIDQALLEQEEKIRVILKELDDTNLQVKALTEENERLRCEAISRDDMTTASAAELTKSQEQLRLMSEKVEFATLSFAMGAHGCIRYSTSLGSWSK